MRLPEKRGNAIEAMMPIIAMMRVSSMIEKARRDNGL
jgi:hypothetical protein